MTAPTTLTRSDLISQMSEEYKQLRRKFYKSRVRAYIREVPYKVGFLERSQIEALVETEYWAIVCMDKKIQAEKEDDKEEVDRQWELYFKLHKQAKELRSSLLITPSSRQNALLAGERNDALALMSEARRRILARGAARVIDAQALPAP
jgi:hypothetical protein